MNIALIIPSIVGGGAERSAQTIGNYYLERGFRVYYFLFGENAKISYEITGEIVHLEIKPVISDIEGLHRASGVIRKAKKKYKIDCAISFMELSNFLNICSKGREKVIVSVRTVLSQRNDFKGMLYDSRWIRILYNMADRVVAVSDFVKRDLIRNYGVHAKKIAVIVNPALRHEGVKKSIDWPYGDKTIICIGRLEPVKQQDRVIRSFSYVKEMEKEAELLILGNGKIKGYLERVSRLCHISDAVHFLSFTEDVDAYLKRSRVFVMASRAEGFPNAMVEAMANGVPVVTTDSPGGCGEIVGKRKDSDEVQMLRYGILTPYIAGKAPREETLERKELILGKAMLSLLQDENLYEHYSERSIERAKCYSLERVMTYWDEAIGAKRKIIL